MPKLKTNRSSHKRFKKTASGLYKHRSAYRNHNLTKKAKKRKVHLRPMSIIDANDRKSVAKMLRDVT